MAHNETKNKKEKTNQPEIISHPEVPKVIEEKN